LRFENDARLIALIRAGHDGAFEVLFNRYHSRLLGFCQSMVKSRQDAEDVLQEVFANAHAAMLKDERVINVRPWLYRIARNRCLNHLRRPAPEGQDSMDIHPHQNGVTTAEHVQNREELRQVLVDVRTLPETQRTALLLREIDQLTYEEIAQAMDTTVPAIKSLLVRARIALAESSQARLLTCEEVQVELAEAAEGIGKASGPARKHVRGCDGCRDFRTQLRSDRKALAALFPLGPFAFIKGGALSKLFGGGAAGGTGAAGAGVTGTGAVGGASAIGGATAAGGVSGGLGLLSGAMGAKAAAGVATAALLTAGAVEVRNITAPPAAPEEAIVRSAPPVIPVPEPRPAADFAASAPRAEPAAAPVLEDLEAQAAVVEEPVAEPVEAAEEALLPEEAVLPEEALPAEPVPVEEPGKVAIGVDPTVPAGHGGQENETTPLEPVAPVPTPTDTAPAPAPAPPSSVVEAPLGSEPAAPPSPAPVAPAEPPPAEPDPTHGI